MTDPPPPRPTSTASPNASAGSRGEWSRIAHRCSCGRPDVVETAPRLPDGTPFPTTYYLVDPIAAGAISTLEAEGVMREMSERLAADPELAAALRRRARGLPAPARRPRRRRRPRDRRASPPGGMPSRVKCLHALVGHALAAGPGVNPFGDETLERLAADGGWPAVCPHGPHGVSRRVAAVDCGTNSLRLLVADVDRRGRHQRRARTHDGGRPPRPGRRPDRAPSPRKRCSAPSPPSTAARRSSPGTTSTPRRCGSWRRPPRATSPTATSSPPGSTPAWVSARRRHRATRRPPSASPGATRELGDAGAPFLVVDLGGGSTELVLGAREVEAARSLDVGSVRMTERHLHDDPPQPRPGRRRPRRRRRRPRRLRRPAGPDPHPRRRRRLDHHHHRRRPGADRVRPRCPARGPAPARRRSARPATGCCARPAPNGPRCPSSTPVASTSSAPGRWSGARSSTASRPRPGITEVVTSEHDILDGIAVRPRRRLARLSRDGVGSFALRGSSGEGAVLQAPRRGAAPGLQHDGVQLDGSALGQRHLHPAEAADVRGDPVGLRVTGDELGLVGVSRP